MTTLNDTITTSNGSDTITLNNNGSSIWGSPAFDTITLGDYTASSTAYNSGIYVNTMNGTAAAPGGSTYTISSNSTISGISDSTFTYNGASGFWNSYNGKPFVDNFPEWNAFKKLCNDYPGLDKAYENLKSIYTICYEDSILPKDDE